ncbi:MAG TPA: transporter, partial [Bryobacteraceae bacterium]|nr:transporter [Bryobacteraceae bacterium]
MSRVFCFALILLGSAATAFPQSDGTAAADSGIVTDRPDVTESSIVIPPRSLQFENGFTWTTDHGTQSVDFSQTLIRLGILERTEFRLVVPDYIHGVGPIPLQSGFEDLAIGMKQQLGPLPGGVDLSVIAAVSIPTGARGVSSGGYDPFVKFPWSKELEGGWSIGGMQSLFWNTDGTRRNGVWEPTFYLEKQLTRALDAFMEYAGDYAQRGEAKQLAHFGAAYRL